MMMLRLNWDLFIEQLNELDYLELFFIESNREIKLCLNFYDMEFNHLKSHHVCFNSKEKINCPTNFNLMKSIWKELLKIFIILELIYIMLMGKYTLVN